MVKNNTPLAIAIQGGLLKKRFPNSSVSYDMGRQMIWKGDITPLEMCNTYKVKITYTQRGSVDVFVLSPKPLMLAEGKTKLPHVYCQKRQKLCLYFPREWTGREKIVDTILPWTAEWLFHYECWVATGEWKGGGIHPTPKKPKMNKK